MGKSNRIRNSRASAAITSGIAAKEKKNGMPSWAVNLITIVVAVIIVASVAISVLVANGTFMRMRTAAASENFRVNGAMMNYYFQTQYSSFVSENSSYLSYYGLNTGVSLKEQYVDTSSTGDGTTWFDYMMTLTKAQVQELLVYCEEAEARGIKLDDADKAAIDAELDMYTTSALSYGYASAKNFVAAVYGEGMKLKDIEKCLEISTLAAKCAAAVGEELTAGITDGNINDEYNNNKLDYDMVDFAFYSFDTSFKEAAEAVLGKDYKDEDVETKSEEVIAKYKELIAEQKAKADELATKTTVEEFKLFIITEIANDNYDSSYDTANDESDIASEKLPSEDELKTIKEKLTAYVIDLLANDKEYEAQVKTEGETSKLYDITITAEFAKFAEDFIELYISDCEYDIDTHIVTEVDYEEGEKPNEWAFEDGRAAGDIKVFEEGDGAEGAELSTDTDALNKYSASSYFVTKPKYRDETKAKDIGVMVFSSNDAAKNAASRLSAGMSFESFEAIGKELGANVVDYKDYVKGTMGVSAFDTWAYADDIALGSVTSTPIEMSESGFALALYYGDGHENWYIAAKNAIFSERNSEKTAELAAKYAVEFKDKTLNKIDA